MGRGLKTWDWVVGWWRGGGTVQCGGEREVAEYLVGGLEWRVVNRMWRGHACATGSGFLIGYGGRGWRAWLIDETNDGMKRTST